MTETPVLLVHGFASSFRRNWQEPGWVDVLQEEGHPVIGVDLLGHGDAPRPTDPEAYRDMLTSIVGAIEKAGPVDAVGFSMGGQLLLRLAAAEPERFRRVVVGGVGDSVFQAARTENAARALEAPPDQIPEDVGPAAVALAHFARSTGNDPAALAACLRRPEEPLTAEELQGLSRPVLVVLGDRDFAGPAERLMAALPDARLKTLTGTDHFATPKDFRFLDAVVAFLR